MRNIEVFSRCCPNSRNFYALPCSPIQTISLDHRKRFAWQAGLDNSNLQPPSSQCPESKNVALTIFFCSLHSIWIDKNIEEKLYTNYENTNCISYSTSRKRKWVLHKDGCVRNLEALPEELKRIFYLRLTPSSKPLLDLRRWRSWLDADLGSSATPKWWRYAAAAAERC